MNDLFELAKENYQFAIIAAGAFVLFGAIKGWEFICKPTIEDVNHPFKHFILQMWGEKGYRVFMAILGILLMICGVVFYILKDVFAR